MQCLIHWIKLPLALQWRHNGRNGVSNHRHLQCLLNRLFRRRSTKTSKLRVTGICAGNSPVTGEFPAQRARNTNNVYIWFINIYINICLYLASSLKSLKWVTIFLAKFQSDLFCTIIKLFAEICERKKWYSSVLSELTYLTKVINFNTSMCGVKLLIYPNFNGCIIEVSGWVSNVIPLFMMDVVIYPCWDLS